MANIGPIVNRIRAPTKNFLLFFKYWALSSLVVFNSDSRSISSDSLTASASTCGLTALMSRPQTPQSSSSLEQTVPQSGQTFKTATSNCTRLVANSVKCCGACFGGSVSAVALPEHFGPDTRHGTRVRKAFLARAHGRTGFLGFRPRHSLTVYPRRRISTRPSFRPT